MKEEQTFVSDEEQLSSSQQVFVGYYESQAARTRKRQRQELGGLRDFLNQQGHSVGDLAFDAKEWAEVKCTEIEHYLAWLRQNHYTASSIKNQLYTIRAYARLASSNGFFSQSEYACIDEIKVEPDREGQPRIGRQKPTPLSISDELAQRLLSQPNTPRGNADALMLSLFLNCGLWPREVASLDRTAINLEQAILTFYDYRADDQKILQLDQQTLEAAKRYLQTKSPYDALFVGNRKESTKQQRLTDRAINARVRVLGQRVGLTTLSPNDCHNYWEQKQSKSEQAGSVGAGKSKLLTNESGQQKLEIKERLITYRPPQRKSRPDLWNRRSFEESMLRRGVPESMIAPYISEYRLLIPLMVKHLDKEIFLKKVQQDRQDLKLSPETDLFWKLALEQIEQWMSEQLENYRVSRQER
jgi:site-specific recombinase XerD